MNLFWYCEVHFGILKVRGAKPFSLYYVIVCKEMIVN